MCHGQTLYRVFVLADTLQVDLSFWPATEFGASGAGFRLLFGAAAKETPAPVPTAAELIGMAWLHALHARSSIARGHVWQAECMISGMRDQVLALACLRTIYPHATVGAWTAFRARRPLRSSRRSYARSTPPS